MNFTFLEVADKDLLDKVYGFRYQVLTEIYPGYLQKSGFSDAKEQDKYDTYSVHFAALNKEGEVCATLRFISHSPIGYPTENNLNFDNSMFEREKLAEMSRIFIDARYRNMKTTKILINGIKKLVYFKIIKEKIQYIYGSLEENFLRLLQIYKIPYIPIGEKQEHENFGLRYPCILYIEDLAKENPEFIKLWREQKNEI